MGWIVLGNGIPFRMGGGNQGQTYWASLISATVENTDPDAIVLTFPSAQPTLTDTDFTVTVNGSNVAVSSASWAGDVLTLDLASDCVYGDVIIVTFVRTGGTTNVTNNINAEAELTTYITGLATPLSSTTLKKLNDYLRLIKTDLGVADLDDAKDVDIILAGETAESSLKNIAKNAHHATAVNAPVFTAFEGFTGDGISSYVEVDYTPSSGTTYELNSAHCGLYFRTFQRGTNQYNGVYSTTADGGTNSRILIGSSNPASIALAINSNQAILSDPSTSGYIILSREEFANFDIYINKNKNTLVSSSYKIPNQKLVVGARRTEDTTVGLFNTSQIAHITLGKGLSDTEAGKQTDDFEAYMDSNGKGVIA